MTPTTPAQPSNQQMLTPGGDTHQAWQAYFDALSASVAAAGWQVGDYRQTTLSAAQLGSQWLPCDGSERITSDYPALSALVLPVTGAGQASGSFLLPDIAPEFTTGNTSTPVLATFIRAQ